MQHVITQWEQRLADLRSGKGLWKPHPEPIATPSKEGVHGTIAGLVGVDSRAVGRVLSWHIGQRRDTVLCTRPGDVSVRR